MGWKTFQERFGIEHTVHVRSNKLMIATSYIPDLVVIDMETGVIEYGAHTKRFLTDRYPHLLTAEPEAIRAAIAEKDVFEKAIPVYYWSGADIIETFCEEVGWPNVTHDGVLMYDNHFSPDRDKTIARAKADSALSVEILDRDILDMEARLAEIRSRRDLRAGNLVRLNILYPGTEPVS